MKQFRTHRYILLEVLILFLLSLTPFLWVGNGWVILGHDSGFRLTIVEHMRRFWDTWNMALNTGTDWSLYKGFLIIQFPELILQQLLGSLEKAQPFILSFWFFAMAMGMYLAMLGFFPEKKHRFLRLYTSIFWVFNFYILQAWFIAERAKFSLYAALPLAIYLIISTFERRRSIVVSAVLFGLLYFVCNGGGSPPLFGATIIVWGITFLYYSALEIRKRGGCGIFSSGKIIVSFLLSFLFFNSYWLLTQIGLFRGTYSGALADQGGIEGLLAWEKEISKYASISNLLRLQGMPDWYNNPAHSYAAAYLSNPFLVVASFIPVVLIVSGIFLYIFHKKKNINYSWLPLFFILLFIGLFFAAGSHVPTGPIYMLLMRKVPGFAIFRSSFYKFAPVVWFCIIVLSGYFLSLFLEKIKGRVKIVIEVTVLVGILLYHAPYFSTKFFQFDPFFTTRVKIPEYVRDAATFLDSSKSNGRVLVYPRLDSGFINKPIDTYEWGFYSLDILPRSVSTRAIVANDSPDTIVSILYDAIDREDQKATRSLSIILGISDVLYRDDVKLSKREEERYPKELSRKHLSNLFGDPVFHKGLWSIYHIQDIRPTVFITSSFIEAVEPVLHEGHALIGSSDHSIRVSATSSAEVRPLLLEAECLFCAKDEYDLFASSIFLPAPSKWSKLQSVLKKITKPKEIIPEEAPAYIDVLLSESQEALGKLDYSSYESRISRIKTRWENLSGRNVVLYANRLGAFLLKHQLALQAQKIDIPVVSEMLEKLRNSQWVSDETMYRYGITVSSPSTYLWESYPPVNTVIVNGKTERIGIEKYYEPGYYRMEIPREDKATPPVLFLRTFPAGYETPNETNVSFPVSPGGGVFTVEDAASSSLLVYPTSFDRRWQARDVASNQFLKHVLVDGYANGWIIPPGSTAKIAISYAPKNDFTLGVFISSIAIVSGILLLYLKRKTL